MDIRVAMRELGFVSVEAEFSGGGDESQFDAIMGYPACGSRRELIPYGGIRESNEIAIIDYLYHIQRKGGWGGDGPGIYGAIVLTADGSAVLTGWAEVYVKQDSEHYHYDYTPETEN